MYHFNYLIIGAFGNIVNHSNSLMGAEQLVTLLLSFNTNATYTIFQV